MVLPPQFGALSSLATHPVGFRFERVRSDDAYLDVIAFGALEQPVFETDWSR
jgi:hypothetical protein